MAGALGPASGSRYTAQKSDDLRDRGRDGSSPPPINTRRMYLDQLHTFLGEKAYTREQP